VLRLFVPVVLEEKRIHPGSFGNLADMACSLTALGALYTVKDAVENGISFKLEIFFINLEFDLPVASDELHGLNRQREIQGKQQF
jgi:phosphatidate phosphatase PAH1